MEELKIVLEEIQKLNNKIDSVQSEMKLMEERLNNKIDKVEERLNDKIDKKTKEIERRITIESSEIAEMVGESVINILETKIPDVKTEDFKELEIRTVANSLDILKIKQKLKI
ncbi:MAG: hypothetical protein FWC47_00860 [Oscillospiraceae bacterium]|nr:hypothetical protein [Oscillospiraceae bacterium]